MKKYYYLLLLIFVSALLLTDGCSKKESKKQQKSPAVTKQQVKDNLAAKQIEMKHPDEFLTFNIPKRKPITINMVSYKVKQPPVVDGKDDDAIWQEANSITTLDYATSRPITLKSVHTDNMIYFMVSFPDVSKSDSFKSFGWDYQLGIYKELYDREDVFIFKWSMVGNNIDMSYRQPEAHIADIWFWKAKRTQPSGYADDKIQRLSYTWHKDASKIALPNKPGKFFYLRREGDEGSPAYKERLLFEYQGDVQSQYIAIEPTGSRADIRAQGIWKNGVWTIEFARKLNTGHADDVQLTAGKTYLFGVSLMELAYDKIHPEYSIPLFRSGDIFDKILLRIE